jgi:alkyl sulfatase BDS1-like metallo-beta-lactamase superfamily hydrolase
MSITDHTAAHQQAVTMALPFTDTQDFVDARRGFIATLDEVLVTRTDGRVVWDLESYGDISGDAPPTVNPSLWRQAQLNLIHGLFEVVPGIYQVRGLDISNMTMVEGDRGVIVIDPLVSCETAAASLALYRSVRGDRPVTALIYTHSHIDHFGGARGVLPDGEPGDIPIVAPEHFVEHAVSENLQAGTAMGRRAGYMYGNRLPKGPRGQMTCGLGPATSSGTVSLIPPTIDVTTTGQELVLDGVRIVFQMTPGTEAPAEMNFHFPEFRALCMAENATHNLHNVVTLRGAVVRDSHAWAGFLDESIDLFADVSDVSFASHHWPTWGRDNIVLYLSKQRDLYAYLHDQTLRLMNKGYTGAEIAEMIELPPTLAESWHCRGYYGSVSHNVKAVYQRYLGWFDGNPAHLWPHPPEAAAVRYVEFMGGADAVLVKAQESFDDGDYRWVAEVVNHVVFADPSNTTARELLARTYLQMGFGAENATWRNFFLTGAMELAPVDPGAAAAANAADPVANSAGELLRHLTVAQIFDALAVRLDGPRAGRLSFAVNWTMTETGERHLLRLENAVVSHIAGRHLDDAALSVTIPRAQLLFMLFGFVPVDDLVASGDATVEGDVGVLETLRGLLDPPDPRFAIVTP